jgi:hypothetical protein
MKIGTSGSKTEQVDTKEIEDKDTEPRTKQTRKQSVSVEVILAAGNVIGHLRKLLTYTMFNNRKDKADAELSIAELEAALKK